MGTLAAYLQGLLDDRQHTNAELHEEIRRLRAELKEAREVRLRREHEDQPFRVGDALACVGTHANERDNSWDGAPMVVMEVCGPLLVARWPWMGASGRTYAISTVNTNRYKMMRITETFCVEAVGKDWREKLGLPIRFGVTFADKGVA